MTAVMHDHPAWVLTDGVWLRAFGSGREAWAVTVSGDRWLIHGSQGTDPDVFALRSLPATVPSSLRQRLTGLETVVRWRNPDLWDAIATAIIRQVIRADQARRLQLRFCVAHGTRVQTPHGDAYTMPDPATVVDLPADAFASLGLAFKRAALQAAADAYLDEGAKWRELTGTYLVEELKTVPRIGPWTAGSAVADWTNDFALYPYGDLAVRKWAVIAAPDIDWPTTEDVFAARWRRIAADHLGPVTLFTLAWGGHHGGSP